MIKCNVTIRGKVSRAATIRANKDGIQMANFAIKTTIAGKNENKELEIFVDHNDLSVCNGNKIVIGNVIEMQGVLTFRKKGEAIYLNFVANTLNLNPADVADTIEGNMDFKGTVGKQIDEKTDKKGGKYISFSAYSAEKVGEAFEYLWVRFIRFSAEREAFLQPKAKIQAKGKLGISVYQGRITLDCRLEELYKRDVLPFYQNNNEPPF